MSSTMWTVTTVCAVLGAAGMGWWLRLIHRSIAAEMKGYQAPQLRFRYTAKQLSEEFAVLGDEKCKLLRRFDLLFVPMLVFAGLCMAVVAHNAAGIAVIRRIMYALTCAACFFGFAETLFLTAQTRCAKAASACSLIKWIFFGVWVALMFVSLFITSTVY